MTKQEAIRILDEVIPPPEHHTVDLDHLRIAQAWLCIKETLTAEPKDCKKCKNHMAFQMAKMAYDERRAESTMGQVNADGAVSKRETAESKEYLGAEKR